MTNKRHQRGDVLAAVAQGGDFDLERVDPIVQVGPQQPLTQGPGDPLVGRRHEAKVGFERLRAAERAELAFLEHAQKTGLQGRGHFRDLVEKQRAARRGGDHAGEIVDRPGERPLHISEEFALDQMLRQRGAVQFDEWSTGPSAAAVDQVGDDLLAHPALAGDEHVRLGGGDLRDEFLDLDHAPVFEHRGHLAGSLFEEGFEFLRFLAEADRLAHELLLLERTLHQTEQFLRRVGFADEMERAEFDGFDGVAQRILSGQHDDLNLRRSAFYLR